MVPKHTSFSQVIIRPCLFTQEQVLELAIDNEGTVFISKLGLCISGLTLDEANEKIK